MIEKFTINENDIIEKDGKFYVALNKVNTQEDFQKENSEKLSYHKAFLHLMSNIFDYHLECTSCPKEKDCTADECYKEVYEHLLSKSQTDTMNMKCDECPLKKYCDSVKDCKDCSEVIHKWFVDLTDK